ncbi:hypothetical protein [Brucella sp. 10RB9213]|uniref:hypothetical protein n=1 Tax=Brucella sp. 10RB9213 TaxID=1844039 RepID=UPI0012AD9DDC|nr:hypothetical protein [Brucella sp. 10RB9213]MRN66419.1 hypothetical protein [Brucella sp. 10RB9213]
MLGFEIRFPKGGGAFIEYRKEWVGFGRVDYGEDSEVFLGHIQLTLSKPRGFNGYSQRATKRKITYAAMLALAVMTHYCTEENPVHATTEEPVVQTVSTG